MVVLSLTFICTFLPSKPLPGQFPAHSSFANKAANRDTMKASYGRKKENLASVFSNFEDSHSLVETKSNREGKNVLCDRKVYYIDNCSSEQWKQYRHRRSCSANG